MQKTFYTVIAGAPGSLITEPPDPATIRVRFSEADSQDDGRGWVAGDARFHRERFALAQDAKDHGTVAP